jgi:hypothetical protein
MLIQVERPQSALLPRRPSTTHHVGRVPCKGEAIEIDDFCWTVSHVTHITDAPPHSAVALVRVEV